VDGGARESPKNTSIAQTFAATRAVRAEADKGILHTPFRTCSSGSRFYGVLVNLSVNRLPDDTFWARAFVAGQLQTGAGRPEP
jgi:hypothetical protein